MVLRPFQLAPGAPLESRPLTAEQPASIEASVQHTPETTSGCLTEIARDHGPDFTWRPAWSPNTFQAHRLLSLALEQGALISSGNCRSSSSARTSGRARTWATARYSPRSPSVPE
ncbi:hypothetical protein ACF1BP_20930 [Streptomyces sp. NPDC014735]|uniref:hypothetical protein n=1 Tax=unclassified Streptomyces TaxID=2593676 RepID=UPI0036FA1668